MKPLVAIENILGSIGSTLTGVALGATSVVGAGGVPHTAVGWIQLALGVLAIFAR